MSKTPKSASKSRSRSKSKSRSRSVSRSSSRSRSRSRKKYRHSSRSRSRSRSRSHSPSHNRERNYPREYQNNREFRGYHRGFRRPYYFRGRGRGFFPRGRFQRGRGGGYNNNNNNYRPNNWQNYRPHPQQLQQQQQQQQQLQQQHYPHSPRRGRSRTPKKRSGSPRSHSHSRHSDRSSSPRSRRSRRSPSSSRSSSPKRKAASGSAKQSSKGVKEERSAAKEVQKEGAGGGGGGGGDEEVLELSVASEGAEEGLDGGPPGVDWLQLTDYSTSPKRDGSQVRSAVIVGQATPTDSPAPNCSNATGNGAASKQPVGGAPSTKSPSQRSPTPVFSGFGFFSKDDSLADKEAISTAFKKFLEEHNKKKQSARENGRDMESNGLDGEQQEKGNGKSPKGIFDKVSVPRAPKGTDGAKGDKEKHKHKDNYDDSVSLNSLLCTSPFCEDGKEEKQERVSKPRPKAPRLDWDAANEDPPKPKSSVALSTRELFEERFGKWEDLAYVQAVKDDDLEAVAEELYRSQRREKAAAIAAALAKRGMAGMFAGHSPERSSRERRKEKAQLSSPSPSPPPRRNSEREKGSGKKGEFNVRLDSLSDDMASSSEVLASERWSSRDLLHPSKKEQGFRSIFHHVPPTQQLPKSPSELFAQHIVTIVHRVKAQHFPASEMTLNERFAMYQRRAAASEMAKPRKSPEIHRRIDVSPSAFKKHSQLFEGTKSSGDGSYKEEGQKGKGDSNDLRLDIERRKKCSTRERDYKWDGERGAGESPEPSRDRSDDVSSKHHKTSKKCKKTHSRSRSSSSSSSSESHGGGDCPREEPELKDEGFDRARLGHRDYVDPTERGRPRGGLQFRIRGRGWNRGNYQGSSTNGNALNMPIHTKNEDWDPEFTPKSRKYYLHDDRDWESEPRWFDTRGRGRASVARGRGPFIFRKANAGTNNSNRSPKWTHDKFQGDGEEGDAREEDPEQDHNEAGSGDVETTEQ